MIERSDRNPNGDLRGQDLLKDLTADGPVQVGPAERLWKVHIFRPASGRSTHLQHRIYSKLKPNGKLALVTFAVHRPNGGQPVRSGVAHVPELTHDDLERIIGHIREQTQAADDEYAEIDLSDLGTLPEQIEYLKAL